MTTQTVDVFLNTGVGVLLLMLVAWLISLPLKNASIADIVWGFGFVLVTWVTFLTVDQPTDMRQVLLVGIPTFWGLRLSLHLFRRNQGKSEDKRYQAMRARYPDHFGWVSLATVFGLQGVLMLVVSLPLQLGQLAPVLKMGWVAYAGVALCAVGLFFEVLGDHQLVQFKKNADNKGKVMNVGLWRFTRHPNYFGDCCLWWGLGLMALETHHGVWGLLGPALITYLLTQVSGIPLLEEAMLKGNPRYRDYMAVTSALVPWPPKKQG